MVEAGIKAVSDDGKPVKVFCNAEWLLYAKALESRYFHFGFKHGVQ